MKTYSTVFPYFPKDDIDKIIIEIREVLEGNKLLTMGENVLSFEKEFSAFCGTKFAIATSSCSNALEISLRCLNLSDDDEVIVPVQTFIATGSSVLKAGGKIIFCDVDDNFQLDFESLKKTITGKTKAVIIVHFAGLISRDIFRIRAYLQERGIILIEDCAHAHGATIDGVKAGNIGDFGCFSFYSTKIITAGEGGMITTNNSEYYEVCASIRSRGMDVTRSSEVFIRLGSNYRVTEIQGIMGRSQLARLPEFLEHRNKIANIYRIELNELADNGKLRFQNYAGDYYHSYWRFIVFLDEMFNRDEIQKKMSEKKIKVDAPYSPLLHMQPVFGSNLTFNNAERLSKTHVSLPMHMLISEEDAHYIANVFKDCLND